MKSLLFFVSILFSSNVSSQSLIRIDSIESSELKNSFFNSEDSMPKYLYKINYISSRTDKLSAFENLIGVDTLKILEELLNLQGDKRLCAIPITAYAVNPRNMYDNRKSKFCTIEVEALFLINRFFLPKPITYSPYPVIVLNRRDMTLSYEIKIKTSYELYRKWFKKMKKNGILQTLKVYPNAFYKSNLEWYR